MTVLPPVPSREAALAALPPALEAALADERVIRWRHEGVDDTSITLISVEREDGHVYLERRSWTFDEQSLTWLSDGHEYWELPGDVADRVAVAMVGSLRAGEER